MRTGNRRATYDLLVALEGLISDYVSENDETFKQSVLAIMPFVNERRPMSTNNFRAMYFGDHRLSRLRELTVVPRRWEDKSGKTYVRKTKRMSNRRLVQHCLDDWGSEGFEFAYDCSLRNVLIKQLRYFGVEPFFNIPESRKKIKESDMKKFLLPVKWVKNDIEYEGCNESIPLEQALT